MIALKKMHLSKIIVLLFAFLVGGLASGTKEDEKYQKNLLNIIDNINKNNTINDQLYKLTQIPIEQLYYNQQLPDVIVAALAKLLDARGFDLSNAKELEAWCKQQNDIINALGDYCVSIFNYKKNKDDNAKKITLLCDLIFQKQPIPFLLLLESVHKKEKFSLAQIFFGSYKYSKKKEFIQNYGNYFFKEVGGVYGQINLMQVAILEYLFRSAGFDDQIMKTMGKIWRDESNDAKKNYAMKFNHVLLHWYGLSATEILNKNFDKNKEYTVYDLIFGDVFTDQVKKRPELMSCFGTIPQDFGAFKISYENQVNKNKDLLYLVIVEFLAQGKIKSEAPDALKKIAQGAVKNSEDAKQIIGDLLKAFLLDTNNKNAWLAFFKQFFTNITSFEDGKNLLHDIFKNNPQAAFVVVLSDEKLSEEYLLDLLKNKPSIVFDEIGGIYGAMNGAEFALYSMNKKTSLDKIKSIADTWRTGSDDQKSHVIDNNKKPDDHVFSYKDKDVGVKNLLYDGLIGNIEDDVQELFKNELKSFDDFEKLYAAHKEKLFFIVSNYRTKDIIKVFTDTLSGNDSDKKNKIQEFLKNGLDAMMFDAGNSDVYNTMHYKVWNAFFQDVFSDLVTTDQGKQFLRDLFESCPHGALMITFSGHNNALQTLLPEIIKKHPEIIFKVMGDAFGKINLLQWALLNYSKGNMEGNIVFPMLDIWRHEKDEKKKNYERQMPFMSLYQSLQYDSRMLSVADFLYGKKNGNDIIPALYGMETLSNYIQQAEEADRQVNAFASALALIAST